MLNFYQSEIYIILLYLTYFYFIKLINQSGCFTEHVLTRETTLLDNPNIYNTEEGNRLSSGLQPLTTGSVLKICFYFQTRFVILFTLPVILLLSSTKQNILFLNIYYPKFTTKQKIEFECM